MWRAASWSSRTFKIVGEVRNDGADGAPVRGYDEVSQEIGRYLA